MQAVLGQTIAGLPGGTPLHIGANAIPFQFPGPINSAGPGRDQALLAMMHREGLFSQRHLQQVF
jgi:hypothetical protein